MADQERSNDPDPALVWRVVAACRLDDEDHLADQLTALGLTSVGTERLSGARLRLSAEAPTRELASEAVRALRARGVRAVEGPPSETQAVGWERRNAPVWFAADALVCFPWSRAPRGRGQVVVEIDPAGGFGAGSHPSTLLLLGALASRRPIGARVLDVGCGSGVLAVAAAELGAIDVVAIDVDDAAVEATIANAAYNDVDDRVAAGNTPVTDVNGAFDVVLANIHAPALVSMARHLRRLLAPGGWLGASGISRAQEDRLVSALAPLAVVDRTERDDWVALVLT